MRLKSTSNHDLSVVAVCSSLQRRLCLFVLFFSLTLPAVLFAQQQARQLDTTTFVVLGEGLAGGMSNYGMNEVLQKVSFPALVAKQMDTIFPQPLFEGPGIGDVLGYQSLPVRVPTVPQGRVRVYPDKKVDNDEAPTLFVFNLSVPNLRLVDSVAMRPLSPLVHDRNPQQTAVNLILGFPSMILERNVPLWSQFEYARAMVPSMALVELGYFDVLSAAVAGNPALIPDATAFRAPYAQIVRGLREMQVEVIVTTIPDPMDTAYFSRPAAAANLFRIPESIIRDYGVTANDWITREGLTVIGNQFIRRNIQGLPAQYVMRGSVGADISNRVRALNAAITAVANEQGAVVYDLAGLFNRLRTSRLGAGAATLSADYFGGFYSLDGYYPGATGHALIANDLLGFINRTYGKSFPLVDIAATVSDDATTKFERAVEMDGNLSGSSDEGFGEPVVDEQP
jgi:hypothetical protein